MMHRLLLIMAILAIASLACTFGIQAPRLATPGPTVTDEISVPIPEAGGTPMLQLKFGAGDLTINPGSDQLVSGTAEYNMPTFKPVIEQNGSIVTISQTVPSGISGLSAQNPVNKWDLKLGSMPMNLSIEAGAYKAHYDFGGLALSSLTVKDGAAQSDLDFSKPNTNELSSFSYETGASNVSLKNIGNASPATFSFRCGAGNYTLDFSGDLKRDLNAKVEAGLGNVKIVIPKGIPAQITVQGGLSNVTTSGDWDHSGETYSQTGDGPAIVVLISIGAGNLELSH